MTFEIMLFCKVRERRQRKMSRDTKKILVEVVCVIVRNLLNIWKREVLKKKPA